MRWTYIIEELNEKKCFWKFYEKECKKLNETDFRIEKLIKKKAGK